MDAGNAARSRWTCSRASCCFPGTVARALHVDQGLSASAIAAKLGAPFEVVAQQLFDALLLPPVPPAAAAAHVERPLNPLQAAAAAHRGEAYLLEAGPARARRRR